MYALPQCRYCTRDCCTMEQFCAIAHKWVDAETCERIMAEAAAHDDYDEEAETEGWTK